MKSLLDPSPQDTSSLDFDLRTTFEKLWSEVQARESRAATMPDLVHHRVRQDCNGELVDIKTVGVVGPRESSLGIVLIEFVCPRCMEPHDSPLFC